MKLWRTRRWQLAGALALLLVISGGAVWALRTVGSPAPSRPYPGHAVPAVWSPYPSAGAPAAGWRLAFQQRFTGSQLNTSVWGTCYPWMAHGPGCTNFGNTEYEWYLPSQDQVSGGALRLIAQRIPTEGETAAGGVQRYQCRSGMVTTYPGFRFEYGYLQVVAQIPRGAGLWPALWLVPASLRWPPEIDILESWGPPPGRTAMSFIPVRGARISANLPRADFSTGWHTFGLYWAPSQLEWFADGRRVLRADQHIPHQPMYFIANLAEYARPDSAGECSGEMLLRSVSVWQR